MENLLVDDVPAKPAPEKLGRYEIVKRLASGELADLLLARPSAGSSERHIIIKQLRDDQAKDAAFVKVFVAEARLASVLHHHNVVQVQDIGEEGGRPYLAMEYVHGEDVRTILARLHDRGEAMPIEHLVTIGKSVAAALHHAHEQLGADKRPLGIVHGDVSPANILVGYDGNVKVADFGIAKAALQATATQTSMRTGKGSYLAPEQCLGQGVDRRSDVFALGIVLHELATVRRLFKGESDFHTMMTIVDGTVPRPSQHRKDLPEELDKIILKALSRSPADRYQTAAELRTALDRFATKAKLTTSMTALADYMKQLFGVRLEPWLDDTKATAVATIDFDGAAAGLAQPSAEAALAIEAFEIPDKATSESPIARACGRAATHTPTVIARAPKQPVALDSFIPKASSEANQKLPKPKTDGKLTPLPRASTDEKPEVPPRASAAGTPEALPRASTHGKPTATPRAGTDKTSEARPRSNTGGTPEARPRSNTGGTPEARPRSNTGGTPEARPRSNTGGTPEARPRSNTGGTPEALPRANTDRTVSKGAGNRLPPPLQTPRSMPVVATPVVASPVIASPVVAPPVVATPVVAPPVVAPPVVAPPVDKKTLSSDAEETTSISTPPPPPPIASTPARVRKANEATQVVVPLPSPFETPAKRAPTASVLVEPGVAETETTDTAGAHRRKRIVVGMIGAAAIVGVILVVVIGFSSNDVTRADAPANREPTAATPPEIKPPPAPAPPEPPRPERTMRNSQPPPPTADVAAQAPAEPAANAVASPPAEPAANAVVSPPAEPAANAVASPPAEPAANAVASPPTKPAPSPPPPPPVAHTPSAPKRMSSPGATHTPAQATRAVAKPAAKPQTKPVKQPAYDPNSLFLKKP